MPMSEADQKSQNLAVIKNQIVYVISVLKKNRNLEEIMPLVKLLQVVEICINSRNNGEYGDWNEHNIDRMEMRLGLETVQFPEKISFLFNRIHVESAYLTSINKSIAYVIQKDYKNKDINQFFREKTYCTERKKLFITSLKLILADFDSESITGLSLANLMKMLLENVDCSIGNLTKAINDKCSVCTKQIESEPQRSCFCKMISINQPELKKFSGIFKFHLDSFTGLFEADYLMKMLRDNAPRLKVDQYNNENSKNKRRCVIIAKDKVVYSNWSSGSLSFSGEISLNKVKEIEIQVWEVPVKQEGHEKIIAISVVPVQSLLKTLEKKQNPLTIFFEPDGFVLCNGTVEYLNKQDASAILDDINKENRAVAGDIYKKIRLKRRENIFTKFTGFRLARHIEANVPVSVWTDWFQNHIYRLAVPVDVKDKKVKENKEDKALGFNKQKLTITPYRVASPKKVNNGSYRLVSQSPLPEMIKVTPKFNQTNPRTICRFICVKENFAENQEYLPPTPYTCSKPFHSVIMSTPIHSNIQPFIVNISPQKPVKFTENVLSPVLSGYCQSTPKITSKYSTKMFQDRFSKLNHIEEFSELGNNLLIDKSMTRSNIELNNEAPNLSRVRKSESFRISVDRSYDIDNRSCHDANILSKSILKSAFSLNTSIDFVPGSCSPELQNIPVCKIESLKKSDSRNHQNSSENHFKMFNESDKCVKHDWNSSFYEKSSHLSDSSILTGETYPHDTNDDDQELAENHREEEMLGDPLDLPLKFSDFRLHCVLGQGHFGKVLLAYHRKEKVYCAIKSIQKVRASTEAEYDSLISERKILMVIRESKHPFLVGLIGCFQTSRYLLFAMEYACGGDLMGHIHTSAFREKDARFYAACVILAFEFLHSKNIIYRDLKLDNVLMDGDGYAKLTDFGLSKENMGWDDTTTTFCGTPEFLAPEIISYQEYTRVIDWWALGVLMYEMIIGESPFPGEEDDDIFNNILHHPADFSQLSPNAFAIVTQLMRHEPSKRLGYGSDGAEKVKEHVFFKEIDWKKLYDKKLKPPFVPKLNQATDTRYFESEFTEKPVTIEHDEVGNDEDINDLLFRDFDSSQQWD